MLYRILRHQFIMRQ